MTAFNGCAGRVKSVSTDNPSEVVTVLLKAAVLLRVQFAGFLDNFEITEGKFAVLAALDHAGTLGISQADVADELMHSESNVSSLIDRLCQDGLVDRRWSSTDRRKRVLLLTTAGQALVDQIEAARERWAENVLSDVSMNDRRVLTSLLLRFSKRSEINPAHQTRHRPSICVHQAEDKDTPWPVEIVPEGNETTSPQSALERMLSTLGLAGRFAEDEQ